MKEVDPRLNVLSAAIMDRKLTSLNGDADGRLLSDSTTILEEKKSVWMDVFY